MNHPSVLVTTSTFGVASDAPIKRLRRAGFNVIDNPYGRRLTGDEVKSLLTQSVIGMIAGVEPLNRDVLKRSSLKVISRVGSGLSNVDVEAAEEFGITVRSTPDAPTQSVAELTLAAMLSLLRRLSCMNASMHSGRWVKITGGELAGRVVAIVGFGRIGRRLATLLQPFSVRTLVVDPALDPDEPPPHAVEIVNLSTALQAADILTLHASGESVLFAEPEFALAKSGLLFLNAARGGLVDEAALLRALESGRIAGAWMDTFEKEPYAGPLQGRADVMLTPHVGTYTAECRLKMEAEAVDNLLMALDARE